MTTYSAYRWDCNTRTLSHHEELDSLDEVNEWMARTRHTHVIVMRYNYPSDTPKVLYAFEVELAEYLVYKVTDWDLNGQTGEFEIVASELIRDDTRNWRKEA